MSSTIDAMSAAPGRSNSPTARSIAAPMSVLPPSGARGTLASIRSGDPAGPRYRGVAVELKV
ncbi:hypothetical protein [Plantactinospora sp. KLBMP9567]|uniref:hypothetical protein n=1 Tax=Plantactinospora sp. KLBMP9567 TaxID=3085900 RepID=UPI002980EFF0|nr:hypothetical protein [Plantactinospora sp. KLBMP9567]MDW5327529.1 hypothetical protein [Plantactinospora sp. KLBMP9567]